MRTDVGARLIGTAALLLMLTSCDLLFGASATPEEAVKMQLNQLQISIEKSMGRSDTTQAAVLAIVDTSTIPTAGATEAEAEGASVAEALRRERIVRQELSNRLVSNRLIEVVQPTQTLIDQARAEITASNSAALSLETVKQSKDSLKTEYIVNALIDRDGAEVNVVAQRTTDGVVIFQETLLDWEVVTGPATEEAE